MTSGMSSSGIERDLAALLMQHTGDGQVYFTSPKDRQLFRLAYERGLVNESGVLTARGRQIALTIH